MFRRNTRQMPPPSLQPKVNGPTYVSPDSEFQGTMHIEGNLIVDGIIHGTVEVRGDVVISENGLVEGPELRARNLVVHGVLKARVQLEGTLTLSRTARLEGDITANAVSIEAGAFYVGYIETGDVKALPGGRNRPELAGANGEEYYNREGY